MHQTKRWSIFVLCLAFIFSSMGGCNSGTPAGKFASPEATFETARAAIQKDDFATFCDCWTDEGRELLAAGMVFVGGIYQAMAKRNAEDGKEEDSKGLKQEVAKKIADLFDRNGLNDESRPPLQFKADDDEHNRKEMLKLAAPIKDRKAFIVAMLELITQVSERPNEKILQEDAKLSDLKIEGDQAQGKLTQTRREKTVESPISFEKVEGEWRIHEVEKLLN